MQRRRQLLLLLPLRQAESDPINEREAALSFLLKKIVGVGLLVLGLFLVAIGQALAYTGLTAIGCVLLLLGIAALVLKIIFRNRSAPNT